MEVGGYVPEVVKTPVQMLFDYLKQNGIKVFMPLQHVGEVKENFVVIKPSISDQFLEHSTTVTYIDVMCYSPKNKFSDQDTYVRSVKKLMVELGLILMVRPTDFETQPYYDDEYNGWMVSVQYAFYRKKGWGGSYD